MLFGSLSAESSIPCRSWVSTYCRKFPGSTPETDLRLTGRSRVIFGHEKLGNFGTNFSVFASFRCRTTATNGMAQRFVFEFRCVSGTAHLSISYAHAIAWRSQVKRVKSNSQVERSG